MEMLSKDDVLEAIEYLENNKTLVDQIFTSNNSNLTVLFMVELITDGKYNFHEMNLILNKMLKLSRLGFSYRCELNRELRELCLFSLELNKHKTPSLTKVYDN